MIINDKEIVVGHTASEQREVTLEAIRQYAEISGDFNPVHLDEEYALSLIHISEPTRQAEISYAVFCLKKKKTEPCVGTPVS